MTPEQWEIISRIFNEAASLKGEERRRFVEEACAGDEALATEVRSLLLAHEAAGDFINDPIVENIVSEVSEMPTLTGKQVGHYRIERSIGRGGMGDVYLATDTRLERLVALKRLPERLVANPLFVKRFHTEAKAAATIHHPNVATLFSVENVEDRPFITMEYVDGRTLDAVTPPEGMSVLRFLDVFVQLTDALTVAHKKGIIHRDIKPGNIMIAADGTPKILDFGLAQFADDPSLAGGRGSAVTQPGQILGTPSHMSPEQAQGKSLDQRTDIFSLGVVMYEALTGRRPFTGDNNADLISNLLKSEPKPVTDLRPDIPGVISRLIAKCMQKKRADRPQDMNEVRTVLLDAQQTAKASTSTGSFARRLYKESTSVGVWLRVFPILLVIILATIAWYYFSRRSIDLPISFEKMSMRRLSDTNKVGFSQISPDGKSIAFATFEDDGTRTLWIRRIDDRNALQLVSPQRVQFWGGLAMSGDGGQVFYVAADSIGTRGALYRVSSLGGPARKLADPANDVGGLSPDGERILFVRYGEPAKIVSVRALDGSDEQVMVSGPSENPSATNFRDPHFSSDGKSIFFIRYQRNGADEYWSLEKLDLGGRSIRVIAGQPGRISELAVLPDQSGLLTTAVDPESNLQQIFHISLANGKKTRLTNDVFNYFGVSVDQAGRNIVATQMSDDKRLWVGEASDFASLRPLDQEPKARERINWTPDNRLVYDGLENNVSHIWIADSDGRNVQKLSSSDNNDSEPSVSGDGRYVVFTSRRSGLPQVWRMDIDGNNQIPLLNVEGVTQKPTFAADGQTVIFEWIQNQHRSLASVPVTGGDIHNIEGMSDIPATDDYYWAESSDGKKVAYSIWDKTDDRLKVAVRSATATEPKIFDIWPSLVFAWTPDGKEICYRERLAGDLPEMELRKLDVSNGKTSLLISTAPEYIVGLGYSRDGKRVALVRGRNTSNAIILAPARE